MGVKGMNWLSWVVVEFSAEPVFVMKSLGPVRSRNQPPLNRAPLNVKPEYSKGSHDPYLYQTIPPLRQSSSNRKITYPKPDSGIPNFQAKDQPLLTLDEPRLVPITNC